MPHRAVRIVVIAVLALCAFAPAALAALPDVTVTAAPGATSAVAMYALPAGFQSCNPSSGSSFAVGDTSVVCLGSDAVSYDFFQVHVLVADTTPPSIVSGTDLTVDARSMAGVVVTYALPTVADDRAGVGAPVCAPASGSMFPVGLTAINCSVADAAGNTTSKIFRTVTVNALEQPMGVNDVNPFRSSLGKVKAPSRLVLLRSGVRAPVSCSASCHVTLTLQTVIRVKHGHKFVTKYVRIGGGSASFTDAVKGKMIPARLTSHEARVIKYRHAKLAVRLVVTIKHVGVRPTIIFRALKL